MLDALPDVLKEDGYPDVQAFMTTYRKAEAIVDRYNGELAEWERKTVENNRPAEKERYAPSEKKSLLAKLKQLQADGKEQKSRRKSQDRER